MDLPHAKRNSYRLGRVGAALSEVRLKRSYSAALRQTVNTNMGRSTKYKRQTVNLLAVQGQLHGIASIEPAFHATSAPPNVLGYKYTSPSKLHLHLRT